MASPTHKLHWSPKVADACWFGLALLHREHPDQGLFSASEIVSRIAEEWPGQHRPGIQPHIYLHCVAGLPPNSAQYRMFVKDGPGYRLYRDGDHHHPMRGGKTTPEEDPAMPAGYREILEWYRRTYNRSGGGSDDPVMAMAGVGAALWKKAGGVAFIEKLRREWDEATMPEPEAPSLEWATLAWERVRAHEGEIFHTVEGLLFTFEQDGNGLWFFRDGKRIERHLPYSHFERAAGRRPLAKTTDIADLLASSYLFALLQDPRIRGDE